MVNTLTPSHPCGFDPQLCSMGQHCHFDGLHAGLKKYNVPVCRFIGCASPLHHNTGVLSGPVLTVIMVVQIRSANMVSSTSVEQDDPHRTEVRRQPNEVNLTKGYVKGVGEVESAVLNGKSVGERNLHNMRISHWHLTLAELAQLAQHALLSQGRRAACLLSSDTISPRPDR